MKSENCIGDPIYTLKDVEVGMPATLFMGYDQYGTAVTSVRKNGREISITLWFEERIFTWRTTGKNMNRYVEKGTYNGSTLVIGFARDYKDPHF